MYGKECKVELLLFLIIVVEINASNCNNLVTSKRERIPIMSSSQPSASVFFALNFKLEHIPNLTSNVERFLKDEKTIGSLLAKAAIFKTWSSTGMPFISSSLSITSNTSSAIIKRYADNESPCLTHPRTSKSCIEKPLFRITA